MMVSQEQANVIRDEVTIPGDGDCYHQGNIKSIYRNLYSNPQLYIFIPTYIVSIILVILVVKFIFVQGYSLYIGRIASFYILYRYLSLAFSNPGLARQNQNKTLQNYRFCNVCNFPIKKFTRHCEICDVCVEGYDHHCIFIGKCIGKGNIRQFNQFLCMVFSVLIYALIVSVIVSSQMANVQHVGGN